MELGRWFWVWFSFEFVISWGVLKAGLGGIRLVLVVRVISIEDSVFLLGFWVIRRGLV